MTFYTLVLIVSMWGGTSAPPVSIHSNMINYGLTEEACKAAKAQLDLHKTSGEGVGLSGGPWMRREAFCLKEE